MLKKSVSALCEVILLAAAFVLPTAAQKSPADRPFLVHGIHSQTPITPMPVKAATGCTLFNNLSQPPVTFNDDYAGFVSGTKSPSVGGRTSLAMPFTANATCLHVNEIDVAMECYALYAMDGGTCGFELAIYADKGGLPGAVVVTSQPLTANFMAGTCCMLTVANLASTALTAGKQYWVEADANLAQDAATEDAWLFANGPIVAFDEADYGWWLTPGDYDFAMQVLGTP